MTEPAIRSFRVTGMRKFTRGAVNAFLMKYATTTRVLDVGSGGMNQDARFPNRTTVDIDPARSPEKVGDAHELPFPDESYEVVLCSEVLEHLHTPLRAISEMRRVLKPGGLLLLTTRFVYPVHDAPGDYFRFTPYGLRELFKDWDILELEVENDAFGAVAVLLQRIIFQTKLRGGKLTKGLIYVLALFLRALDPLIVERYGDIKRSTSVEVLMTSGVYIACRKPPAA